MKNQVVRLPIGVKARWNGCILKNHKKSRKLVPYCSARTVHITFMRLNDLEHKNPYRYHIVFRDDKGKKENMWVVPEALEALEDAEDDCTTWYSESLCF